MAFDYTEEQRTLQETIHRSFADTVTSEFIRGVVEGKHAGESLSPLINELGLFEFFADSQGPSLIELMLIAYESGRVLLSQDLAGELFSGPFLVRESPEYGKLISKLGVDAKGVNDGSVRIGVGVYSDGAIDFVSSANAPASLCFNPKSQSINICKTKDGVGVKHRALDLTSPKFRYSAENSYDIKDSSVLHALRVLIASELSGIATRVVEMTKDYVSTRKQFGSAIGSFQAVQQQLADMYLKSESLLSLVQFAAWTYDNSKVQLELASLSAIGYAIDIVPQVVETAIQLHGGIGFTWEYDLHLFLRRARALTSMYALSDAEYEIVLTQASATATATNS